jgi:hypothetical protein
MDLTKKFPRAGELLLGGYPWLARAIDKARAYNEGSLGDYIYPCPIDKELLAELNLTGFEFAEIVEQCETDEEVLDNLGISENTENSMVKKWAHEFLENRQDSLIRLAEEEGRVYSPPQGIAVTKRFT